MWQVHAVALHCRPDRGGCRPDHPGRARHRSVEPAETRHRHGVPELRLVPQHDRGTERRLRPAYAKVDAADSHKRVLEILRLVELHDFAGRYPHQLSGGQCQRVALARSLVTRPRLLLLDEPLSALDARIRKHLREQIRQIQRELGLTTIFVTHDQEEALTMSDRIFLMNQGKIVQSGDAETLYTAPVDVFAAGFIGNYNLLDADSATKLLQRPMSGRIAIRPEAIELSRNGEADALIRSHSLLGNVIRYRVEARGVELVVDVLNRSAADLHPDGARLSLSIDPSALCEVA
ncbi:ABC transporter ATP-binding protein [Pseudomonas sp. NA13]